MAIKTTGAKSQSVSVSFSPTGLAKPPPTWQEMVDSFDKCDREVWDWLWCYIHTKVLTTDQAYKINTYSPETGFVGGTATINGVQSKYLDDYIKRILDGMFPQQSVQDSTPNSVRRVVQLAEFNSLKAVMDSAKAAYDASSNNTVLKTAYDNAAAAFAGVRLGILTVSTSTKLPPNTGYSGGITVNGMRTTVSVGFSPLTGVDAQPLSACSKVPFWLLHEPGALFTNNRCNELVMQPVSSQSSGSPPAFTTAANVVAACLPPTTFESARVAEYGVQGVWAAGSCTMPQTLKDRCEPLVWESEQFDFNPPQPYRVTHGWLVYLEITNTDYEATFWCAYRFPFKTWPVSTTKDQGAETQEVDAANLFMNHTGVAYQRLVDWVAAVGTSGTWVGRVVVYDAEVLPMVADVKYDGETIVMQGIFPAAPLYLAKMAYVPGVSKGILLVKGPGG